VVERVLEHDRVIVLGGVVVLAALAWLELWRRAGAMGMDVAMPRYMPWSLADLGAAALMWGVMMIAMMLPSAAPMLLLFSGAQRKRRGQAEAARLTGLFAAGYLVIWLSWSGLAAALQWALQALLLLSPYLATTHALLGAAFLLLAGLYQFTPWKAACLPSKGRTSMRWCRGPGERAATTPRILRSFPGTGSFAKGFATFTAPMTTTRPSPA